MSILDDKGIEAVRERIRARWEKTDAEQEAVDAIDLLDTLDAARVAGAIDIKGGQRRIEMEQRAKALDHKAEWRNPEQLVTGPTPICKHCDGFLCQPPGYDSPTHVSEWARDNPEEAWEYE